MDVFMLAAVICIVLVLLKKPSVAELEGGMSPQSLDENVKEF